VAAIAPFGKAPANDGWGRSDGRKPEEGMFASGLCFRLEAPNCAKKTASAALADSRLAPSVHGPRRIEREYLVILYRFGRKSCEEHTGGRRRRVPGIWPADRFHAITTSSPSRVKQPGSQNSPHGVIFRNIHHFSEAWIARPQDFRLRMRFT